MGVGVGGCVYLELDFKSREAAVPGLLFGPGGGGGRSFGLRWGDHGYILAHG